MKNIYNIFHIFSKISVYVFAFSFLFLLQKFTFGLLLPIKNIVIFNKIYLYEVIFSITSFYIIKKYVVVTTPYEEYKSKC